MQSALTRYKLGLLVLGMFTLAIVLIVLVQAGAVKQDAQTYDSANKIADKLNSYVSSKQKVPTSLDAAGIADTPSTVSYTRVSSKQYEFCVTYKANADGFDPSQVQSDLMGSALRSNSSSSSSSETLYLSSTYHKGKNCQTVKPYIYSGYDSGSSSSSSDPYAKCYTISDNTAYYACLDQAGGGSSSSSTTTPQIVN